MYDSEKENKAPKRYAHSDIRKRDRKLAKIASENQRKEKEMTMEECLASIEEIQQGGANKKSPIDKPKSTIQQAAHQTTDTALAKRDAETSQECYTYFQETKEAYISESATRADTLENRFIEFELHCEKNQIQIGTKTYVNALTNVFPGIVWDKALLPDTVDKKQDKTTATNNKTVVWPSNHKKEYNMMYSKLKDGKAAGTSTDLRQKNETGELDAATVKVLDPSNHPWVLCQMYVAGQKEEGYIHASILSVLLGEVVLEAKHQIANEHTVVKTKSGANIYEKPNGKLLETAAFNDEVFVLSVDPYDWAYILYQGQRAYVNVNFLNTGTPMPCVGAKLYQIKEGEGVDQIVKERIGNGKEMDRRFYANVLLYVNNPANDPSKGIYIEGENFDITNFIPVDYDKFKTRKDYLIWIPTKTYCEGLKGVVNSGSYKGEVKQTIKSLANTVSKTVDKYWPENWGAFYGMDVAATFAIPVGAKAQIETYFYRKDKNTLALKKYDKMAVGFDTGASAGFYVGKKGSKKGDAGIGAKAGVNAEAMLAGYAMAEYEFPIQDNDSVISALSAIFMSGQPQFAAAATFLDIVADTQLSPANYMTKSVLAAGVEAQGSAGASLGIMKAGSNNETESYTHKGSYAADQAPEAYTTTTLEALNPFSRNTKFKDLLLKQLNIGADAFLSINPKIGMAFARKLAHEDGQMIPVSETMEVFLEASGQALLNLSLPMMGKLGPAIDNGLGLKVVFHSKPGEEWGSPTFSLYATGGQMDYYDGAASNTELELGSSMKDIAKNLGDMDATKFVALVKKTKIQKRVHLINFMSRKVQRMKDNVKTQKSKVKLDNQPQKYFDLDGYVDLEIDFSKLSDFELGEAGRLVMNLFQGDTIEKAMQGISTFMAWGSGVIKREDEKVEKFITHLNNAIRDDIFPSAVLHARLGLGVAVGFSAAWGAKVKGTMSASAGLLYEEDIKGVLAHYITPENAMELFRHVQQLEVPSSLQDMVEEALDFNEKAKPY
ncbi:hypothetical protein BFP72_10490 [Reichenbachiella sp. 5M10]|uniref:SH3 domain-containing protein n=1 Tax=Reichenbachiella sp. 5M10 TaxID=1889772 RepID=UPI000C15652F|nr:SH3 domain-containing protein [Reichenbachiella sp. 5M10]PIB35791.1 hypothetical protein BFP72_10490 [Reichenbachiella sp. 5M10]